MSRHHLLRKCLRNAIVALSLTGGAFAVVGAQVAPAQAATIGDVSTVAVADYSCSAQTVTVTPTSNEPLDGNYTMYAYAQVYDFNLNTWISGDQWRVVDGITGLTFHVTAPYDYARINYAKQVSGVWYYSSDWVHIEDDLDNSGVFCGSPF